VIETIACPVSPSRRWPSAVGALLALSLAACELPASTDLPEARRVVVQATEVRVTGHIGDALGPDVEVPIVRSGPTVGAAVEGAPNFFTRLVARWDTDRSEGKVEISLVPPDQLGLGVHRSTASTRCSRPASWCCRPR
jgi:hypothetical protein